MVNTQISDTQKDCNLRDVSLFIDGKNSKEENIAMITSVFTQAFDPDMSKMSIQVVLPSDKDLTSHKASRIFIAPGGELRISPGIMELVQKLKGSGKTVYLISGGFRQMINPVASILGVPSKNIYANNLLFNNSGEFGFDENEPTSTSGGKPTAVELIRKDVWIFLSAIVGPTTGLCAFKSGLASV
ncbi:hypothetical protein L2E82_05259 [Cichorium intybus]|uniref:Uncharacterized protein n=1 Tax=Cichorium intybus TaxID=13427 RepID=A0ACB9H7T0_CICIN|nr:hypothetical protein L2E82_05259 [Cichorium intybus]